MSKLFSELNREAEKQQRLLNEQSHPEQNRPKSSKAKPDSTQSKKERLQESKKERFLADVQKHLNLRSSQTVSFRYPSNLLEKLEETQYTIKRKYGRKLTKNAILVAALAYVIWDLEHNHQDSFLHKQFVAESE